MKPEEEEEEEGRAQGSADEVRGGDVDAGGKAARKEACEGG